MIETPTVFILGAGASKPYHYPTGAELRDLICNNTFVTEEFSKCLDEFPVNCTFSLETELINSGKELAKIVSINPGHETIDAFLNRSPSFTNIGKIAIMYQILMAEKKDLKSKAESSQDWYSYLFKQMMSGIVEPDGFKKFGQNKVKFITFNYDRSLEYFFYRGLRHAFYEATNDEKNHHELLKQLNQIPIYHVYGSVGNPQRPISADYGKKIKFSEMWEIRDNIRIINERINSEEIEQMELIIKEYAERIFFLGFGYADENMEVLNLYKIIRNHQEVFGTAYGLSEREIADIHEKFTRKSRQWANINPDVLKSKINLMKDRDCLYLLKNCPCD
jgi:hypothetical protein